jgi:hypothetical protein
MQYPAEVKVRCKGQVFKCRLTHYIGKNGEYASTEKMIPVKRASCPGCEDCGNMIEWLHESVACDIRPCHDHLEDGQLYALSGQGGGGPDHNGEYDEGEIVFRKLSGKLS